MTNLNNFLKIKTKIKISKTIFKLLQYALKFVYKKTDHCYNL